MENDDELEKIGDSILDQLQQSLTEKKETSKAPPSALTNENLEEFVLQQTATLVNQSMEAVDNLKDYIQAGVSDKEIAAFAEVVKASSGAIETLNKLLIAREKNKLTSELKEKDIQARKELNTQDNQTRLLLSREDLMKQLIVDSENIRDVTPIIDQD
jgi:uncharacterized protein YeeX (DUF496 family)